MQIIGYSSGGITCNDVIRLHLFVVDIVLLWTWWTSHSLPLSAYILLRPFIQLPWMIFYQIGVLILFFTFWEIMVIRYCLRFIGARFMGIIILINFSTFNWNLTDGLFLILFICKGFWIVNFIFSIWIVGPRVLDPDVWFLNSVHVKVFMFFIIKLE